MELKEFFREHPKAAVAFSGGVDSAYLLAEALRCGADVRPYCAVTAFQPAFERREAEELCRSLGVELVTVERDILSVPRVAANPADRCYHCKTAIFTALIERAAEDGYTLILDGTNASDDALDRPGMRALGELGVLSPLRLCGLTRSAEGAKSWACPPGTSPPMPASPPASPRASPSRRKSCAGWRERKRPCGSWGTPISGCVSSTAPPGCSCPARSWSGRSGSGRGSVRP